MVYTFPVRLDVAGGHVGVEYNFRLVDPVSSDIYEFFSGVNFSNDIAGNLDGGVFSVSVIDPTGLEVPSFAGCSIVWVPGTFGTYSGNLIVTVSVPFDLHLDRISGLLNPQFSGQSYLLVTGIPSVASGTTVTGGLTVSESAALSEILLSVRNIVTLSGNTAASVFELSTIADLVNIKLGSLDLQVPDNLNAQLAQISALSFPTLQQIKDAVGSQIPLVSLNGNGCLFVDGDSVNAVDHDGVFIVKHSFFACIGTNSYTIVYHCEKGLTSHFFPEAMLTKVVV